MVCVRQRGKEGEKVETETDRERKIDIAGKKERKGEAREIVR